MSEFDIKRLFSNASSGTVYIRERKISLRSLRNVRFKLANFETLLEVLLTSLVKNPRLVEFISNITGGNIRAVLELVRKFIGSPNVEAEKIIKIQNTQGN